MSRPPLSRPPLGTVRTPSHGVPTEDEIREALRVVGSVARSLGVPRAPLYPCAPTHYWLPLAAALLPDLRWVDELGAHAWEVCRDELTELTRWPTAVCGAPECWTLCLGGRSSQIPMRGAASARAVQVLAGALATLRRWTRPAQPWARRDLVLATLTRIEREASIWALGGPQPWAPLVDPIPEWYLAAFGSAAE